MEERFVWVLGPNDNHCPSCVAMAGQVHTMAEWEAGKATPGSKRLYCQGNCHCRLEPTNEPSAGTVQPGPLRREKPVVANVGWTDEARVAALVVRLAKAQVRGSKGGGDGTVAEVPVKRVIPEPAGVKGKKDRRGRWVWVDKQWHWVPGAAKGGAPAVRAVSTGKC